MKDYEKLKRAKDLTAQEEGYKDWASIDDSVTGPFVKARLVDKVAFHFSELFSEKPLQEEKPEAGDYCKYYQEVLQPFGEVIPKFICDECNILCIHSRGSRKRNYLVKREINKNIVKTKD